MTERQSFSFTREPKTVRAARGALEGVQGELPAAKAYDASLCLSELVTNAIQHSPTKQDEQLQLVVELGDDVLRVEVTDPGVHFELDRVSEGEERGWGLFIVDRLATRWGVDRDERTTVWFEIELGGDSTAAAQTGKSAEGDAGGRGEDDRLLRATALRRARRLAT